MKPVYYEKILVHVVPIEVDGVVPHEVDAASSTPAPAFTSSVMEIIEFIAGLPIRDQVYMLANLLTLSGFTQAEIAAALGVAHQTYRNRLLEIRAGFKDRGIEEL